MVVIALAWAEPVEEVVVDAPARDLAATTPAAVTVIPIDARTAESADLAQVVGSASGASVQRLGGLGDFASVSLRGSTARQVEVLLDGVPLNPDGAGAVDLSDLPLRAFRAVEVWRSSGPGLGGSMGGAVNLVTGEGETTAVVGTVGTLDTARARLAVGRALPDGDVWVAAQAFSTLGDFRWYDDAGTRVDPADDAWRTRGNNDTRAASAHARARFRRGPWTLGLLDAALVREEGVPGFTASPTSAVRYATRQNLLVAQADRSGALPLLARVHLRQRREQLTDPRGELAGDVVNGVDALGGDASVGGLLTPSLRADLFATARHEALRAGELRPSRQVARGRVGLAWWAGERLLLTPELGLSGIWSGQADGAILPRLGALARLAPELVLKANVARTFRPPDATELYGNQGALVGDPSLRPERGLTVDLGARFDGQWGSVELGAFATESVDLITWVQNAQQVAIATNLGRSRVQGVEAAWVLEVRDIDSRTNLTLQRSRNLSDNAAHVGNPLPRVPAVQLDQHTGLAVDRWRFGHVLQLTDGLFTDEAGFYRQPARALHTLVARYTARSGLGVELDVLNALNTRVQQVPMNPLVPDGPRAPTPLVDFVGYPLPGRTVLFSVRYGAE